VHQYVVNRDVFGNCLKLFPPITGFRIGIRTYSAGTVKSLYLSEKSHLVCDPTIWQPGFHLRRQQWYLLNRFRTEQGHCGAYRRKRRLTDTDLCPCGETQTMSHVVESSPLTKLNGDLSRLLSAGEDAVLWLTSYGWWHHAHEKKKTGFCKLSDREFQTNGPATQKARRP